MSETISVIICEDHASFRQGIKNSLNYTPDVQVIGEAVDGVDLLNKLKFMRPDVILLDINMPRLNGVDTLKLIKENEVLKDIKVIMLTMHKEKYFMQKFISLGANAYLNKEVDIQTIYETIKKCHKDDYYFDKEQQKLVIETIQSMPIPDIEPKMKSDDNLVKKLNNKKEKTKFNYNSIIYGAFTGLIIYFIYMFIMFLKTADLFNKNISNFTP